MASKLTLKLKQVTLSPVINAAKAFGASQQKFLHDSKSNRRVVVTGVGLVTCLGVGKEHVWPRLLNGETGITGLTGKEYDTLPCKVAGVVPRGQGPGELDLDQHISPQQQRSISLSSSYALVAAAEALQDAGWAPTQAEAYRTGVAVGMGMSSLDDIADVGADLRNKGYRKVSPHFIPKILNNMPAGHISIKYGFKGPNHAVSTACTTGVHAIGDASRFIQHGSADVMLCGSTEACVGPLSIAGFARMRALGTKFNDNPSVASRPFDKDRDGFVMAEGAGILVLEEMQHALNRGANIYGEILGYGLSGDANHITAPSADGDGAYRCMQAALEDAGLLPNDIGYINAHATSTPLGDLAESSAITKLFGDHASSLRVSSCKGAIGHLLGGAGSVEAIFTLLACKTGMIPPTANCFSCDSPLNCVPLKSVPWSDTKRTVLTNSFGFGGTNASLCFTSVE